MWRHVEAEEVQRCAEVEEERKHKEAEQGKKCKEAEAQRCAEVQRKMEENRKWSREESEEGTTTEAVIVKNGVMWQMKGSQACDECEKGRGKCF